MTIKIRKKISIDDFMELWENIKNKKWDKVMPNWGNDMISLWGSEIREKFTMMKKHGSYGPVSDAMLEALQHTLTHTQMPRNIPYTKKILKRKKILSKDYKYFSYNYPIDYPFTYVKSGFLKKEMEKTSTYQNETTARSMSVKVNIPLNFSVVGESHSYEELEEKRSYIKSSLILAWPKMLKQTLQTIGG